MALIALLKTIPDSRGHRGRRHQLWVLMCLSLLGSLCGYRGYRPLADFARKHHQSWCELLNLDIKTTQCPSYSTFRQLFLRVDAQAWVDVFNDWALHHLPDCWGLLAIDGKSIRCTRSGCSQTGYNYANIVSVYSHSAGGSASANLQQTSQRDTGGPTISHGSDNGTETRQRSAPLL